MLIQIRGCTPSVTSCLLAPAPWMEGYCTSALAEAACVEQFFDIEPTLMRHLFDTSATLVRHYFDTHSAHTNSKLLRHFRLPNTEALHEFKANFDGASSPAFSIRSNLAQSRANLARIGPASGHILATLSRIGPSLARSRPTYAGVRPNLARPSCGATGRRISCLMCGAILFEVARLIGETKRCGWVKPREHSACVLQCNALNCNTLQARRLVARRRFGRRDWGGHARTRLNVAQSLGGNCVPDSATLGRFRPELAQIGLHVDASM